MNDHRDIEEGLKKFRHRPDPRVRRSVMARFRDTVDPTRADKRPTFFWTRPVPLYLAAAVLFLAVGLSFFAGRQFTLANPPTGTFQNSVLDTTFVLPQEMLWEPAQNDIL
jgi:hypothetical protein